MVIVPLGDVYSSSGEHTMIRYLVALFQSVPSSYFDLVLLVICLGER
jgi:hypothetical protein